MQVYRTSIVRYKVLRTKDQYYLVDMESSKLSWIFPVFAWLFKHKVYLIEEGYIVHELIDNISQKKANIWLLYPIGYVISNFISKIINDYNIATAKETVIFVLISTFIIGIILKIVMAKQCGKRLEKVFSLIDLETLIGRSVIDSSKEMRKYVLNAIFCTVFFLGFEIAFIAICLFKPNVIYIMYFTFWSYLVLNLNVMIVYPKKDTYKIIKEE